MLVRTRIDRPSPIEFFITCQPILTNVNVKRSLTSACVLYGNKIFINRLCATSVGTAINNHRLSIIVQCSSSKASVNERINVTIKPWLEIFNIEIYSRKLFPTETRKYFRDFTFITLHLFQLNIVRVTDARLRNAETISHSVILFIISGPL